MFRKKTLIAATALTALFITGCAFSSTVSEESLGLRNTDLYTEKSDTVGDKTSYGKVAAGESKMIDRAFENAPPMISHDIEGMVPITMANNSCLGCHDPVVAPSVNATPVPASHLASFRPLTKYENGVFTKEGSTVGNTADIKTAMHKRDGVSTERYNCTTCHAPQSDNEPLVENTFQAEFRAKNGISRSNLLDSLNEGVE